MSSDRERRKLKGLLKKGYEPQVWFALDGGVLSHLWIRASARGRWWSVNSHGAGREPPPDNAVEYDPTTRFVGGVTCPEVGAWLAVVTPTPAPSPRAQFEADVRRIRRQYEQAEELERAKASVHRMADEKGEYQSHEHYRRVRLRTERTLHLR